jgi:hypothetical protein
MKTTAWISRLISMLALAGASVAANAQAFDDKSLVWIENESFGFEACSSNTSDDALAALTALRARAAAEIASALHAGGVVLQGQQFMTFTPLAGVLGCRDGASEATFRVSAVDRESGKFWSADLKVRDNAADAATAKLADDLARHFRGAQYKAALL